MWLPEEQICTISRNVVFHKEEVFKEVSNKTETPKIQSGSSVVDKRKSVQGDKKRQVTFSPNFIQGPSKGLHD